MTYFGALSHSVCGVCFSLNKSASYLSLHLWILWQWKKNLKLTGNIGAIRKAFTSMAFHPKSHNPRVIMKTHQKRFNRGAFYNILGHYSSKLSKSSKTRQVEKLSLQEEPKETWQLNVMWYPGWDPGFLKRNIRLKTKSEWNIDIS